jgi:hypothetical protein
VLFCCPARQPLFFCERYALLLKNGRIRHFNLVRACESVFARSLPQPTLKSDDLVIQPWQLDDAAAAVKRLDL